LQKAAAVFARFIDGQRVNTSQSDLGHAEFADGDIRFFSCCLNVGLDADAARRANLLPDWLKERKGYFLGGLGALLFYKPKIVKISEMENRKGMESPAWFITISNTPIFGGGLKIAPQAKIGDGVLDVTFAPSTGLSRFALMWNYPKILSGRHVGMNELQIFTARHLRIESTVCAPVYGDGERLGELPVDVKVLPGAIRLIGAD
jgi:diacylglycerol kinase (ATP)